MISRLAEEFGIACAALKEFEAGRRATSTGVPTMWQQVNPHSVHRAFAQDVRNLRKHLSIIVAGSVTAGCLDIWVLGAKEHSLPRCFQFEDPNHSDH